MSVRLTHLLVILLLAGCATDGYVLHTYRKTSSFRKFFFGQEETSTIPQKDGLALLPDRAAFVVIENQKPDGSVWVEYALNLKNDTNKVVKLKSHGIHISSEDGTKAPAVFLKEDKVGEAIEIDPNTYLRLDTRFQLSSDTVKKYANSKDALKLVVPVENGSLDLKVWLWEE